MSEPAVAPPDPAVPPQPQAPFALKLTIVLYSAAYLIGALALLLDFWVLNQVSLRRLVGLNGADPLPPLFLSALHAMLGAVLGAGVLSIVSFHHYTSVRGDFQSRHVWGYFTAPLLAMVLGLIVFALLQSGLLIFAGGAKGEPDDVARLGYLAVGFLAGFGWFEATQSIRRIVRRFFSEATDTPPPAPAPTLAPEKTVEPPASAPAREVTNTR